MFLDVLIIFVIVYNNIGWYYLRKFIFLKVELYKNVYWDC